MQVSVKTGGQKAHELTQYYIRDDVTAGATSQGLFLSKRALVIDLKYLENAKNSILSSITQVQFILCK